MDGGPRHVSQPSDAGVFVNPLAPTVSAGSCDSVWPASDPIVLGPSWHNPFEGVHAEATPAITPAQLPPPHHALSRSRSDVSVSRLVHRLRSHESDSANTASPEVPPLAPPLSVSGHSGGHADAAPLHGGVDDRERLSGAWVCCAR